MIGRVSVLAKVSQVLNNSKSQGPGIVLLSGPSGIGKSTLARYVIDNQECWDSLETRALESSIYPLGLVSQALQLIHTFECNINSPILNNLNEVGAHTTYDESIQNIDRQTLLVALQELFHNLTANKPIIWLIEDIHWADDATLELIPQLIQHISCPLLLILTHSDNITPHSDLLQTALNDFRRHRLFYECTIPLFTREEVEDWLTQHFLLPPTKELLDLIIEKTQGLPLFLEALIQTFVQKGYLKEVDDRITINPPEEIPIPTSIRDAIALQIDQLSEEAKDTLEIAATISQEFELDLLSELIHSDLAIDELLIKQLIIEKRPGKGAFRHVLVRDAIRQNIRWSRRKSLNARIAKAMSDRNGHPEQIGIYWLHAGNREEASASFLAAAEQYCEIHAHRDATRAASRGLELWPTGKNEEQRIEHLERLADCARISGQLGEAIMALKEIADSPLILDDSYRLGDISRSLSVIYAIQASWKEYKVHREHAANYFEMSEAWDKAAEELRELSIRLYDEMQIENALHMINRAIHCASKSKDVAIYAKVLSIKGHLLTITGNVQEGEKLCKEAISISLEQNLVESAAYAYRKLASAYEYSSDYKGSIQAYNTAINYCHEQNLQDHEVFCLSCMCWVLFRLGDWQKAIKVSREVLEDIHTNDPSKSTAELVQGLIRAYRGEYKSAQKHIERGFQLAKKTNFRVIYPLYYWAFAAVPTLNEHIEEGLTGFDRLLEYAESLQDIHDILPGLCAAVRFFAEYNHPDKLSRCVKVLTYINDLTGNHEAIGTMAFAIGEVCWMNEQTDEALENMDKALKNFSALNIPLQELYVTRRICIMLLASGQEEKGKVLLRDIITRARNMGLRPLAASLEHMVESFSHSQKGSSSHSNSMSPEKKGTLLTPRQIEILQGLTHGYSNKQIAEQLFLSTRTVDMHVRHIFDRLNCRSRAEAVRIALEQNLV